MNTFTFLNKAALYKGDEPAMIFGDEVTTYAEFHQRALDIAGNLALAGLAPGDCVAFCLSNSPRILEVIYACFAGGYVVIPVNARLHVKEVQYIVENSGAGVLFHSPELCVNYDAVAGADAVPPKRVVLQKNYTDNAAVDMYAAGQALEAALDLEADAPAWLFYTSGTTGKPKGALWNHRIIRVVIMNYLADLHNIQPGERVAHCAPLSHGSGVIALPAVARGAVNVIYDNASFIPRDLFALVQRHKVSHIAFMAPTQIIKCLDEFDDSYDLSSLTAICYGGAPIHLEHLKAAIDTFGPVFMQLYGQGEAPITISGMSALDHQHFHKTGDARLGSAGTIRTDVDVAIFDAQQEKLPANTLGEIAVRGDVVMAGYWQNAAATEAAMHGDWLLTGDIGMIDESGYLFLMDRSKDVIITGGNNVYPREVEEVIVQHPSVASVVVVGVPDDYWGEAVHAVVQLNVGAQCAADEIIAFCSDYLAGYKKPKAVDFVTEFPVSGYGKILRREIRDRYWNSPEPGV
jgi:long-chain acyl-CoA synthetase